MDEKVIASAMVTERKRYTTLTEVMELTGELSDAFQRQDQVSVQLFLSMRQEPINQLRELQAIQRKRCAALSDGESETLWKLLTGRADEAVPVQLQPLGRLAAQNRKLLERIQQADRQISLKLGGKKSFYSKQRERGGQRQRP